MEQMENDKNTTSKYIISMPEINVVSGPDIDTKSQLKECVGTVCLNQYKNDDERF